MENKVAIETPPDLDNLKDAHALFYLVRLMRTIFGLDQTEKENDD